MVVRGVKDHTGQTGIKVHALWHHFSITIDESFLASTAPQLLPDLLPPEPLLTPQLLPDLLPPEPLLAP